VLSKRRLIADSQIVNVCPDETGETAAVNFMKVENRGCGRVVGEAAFAFF